VDHADHLRLIREGVVGGGSAWADLGSGTGAFTLALADLLGGGGVIYSVDGDRRNLEEQARAMGERFSEVELHQLEADFTRPLELPRLDGIVMANSLHFVRAKQAVLPGILAYLRDGGPFVLVEYDSDSGNRWVPYPISYSTWAGLAGEVGLRQTRRIGSVPSRFLGSIYAALSLR
jgi:SAM-dependent methyltransferase